LRFRPEGAARRFPGAHEQPKEKIMLRNSVSLILCLLLAVPTAAQSSVSASAQEAEVKKRVVEWGTNASVSVKLKAGEKLKGRIAEIKDESFTIQFMEKDKITSREINWSEIKSLSQKSNAGNIAAGVAVGALAAVGVVAIVLLVAIARS
jgi:translation initiation factor IF-1